MAALEPQDFKYLQVLLRREAAIVLSDKKEYLVSSRLSALARAEGASIAAILSAARAGDRARQRQVIEAMTTNETSFFRDPAVFGDMVERVLGAVLTTHPEGPVRIWCAASSTGQEPYSLAMALNESFPDHVERVHVVASDLDTQALQRAKVGQYSRMEVNRGLSLQRQRRFFRKDDDRYVIQSSVASTVTFRTQNLARSFDSLGRQHLILMRNVLIYFDRSVKAEILRSAAWLLEPNGWLVLGSTESILGLETGLVSEQFGRCKAYRFSAS